MPKSSSARPAAERARRRRRTRAPRRAAHRRRLGDLEDDPAAPPRARRQQSTISRRDAGSHSDTAERLTWSVSSPAPARSPAAPSRCRSADQAEALGGRQERGRLEHCGPRRRSRIRTSSSLETSSPVRGRRSAARRRASGPRASAELIRSVHRDPLEALALALLRSVTSVAIVQVSTGSPALVRQREGHGHVGARLAVPRRIACP